MATLIYLYDEKEMSYYIQGMFVHEGPAFNEPVNEFKFFGTWSRSSDWE